MKTISFGFKNLNRFICTPIGGQRTFSIQTISYHKTKEDHFRYNLLIQSNFDGKNFEALQKQNLITKKLSYVPLHLPSKPLL